PPSVPVSLHAALPIYDGDRDGAHGPIPYRRGAPGQPRPGSGAPQWRASHPRGRPPPPAALDAGAFADRRLRGSDDSDASDVVVQLELVRVRAEAERIDLRGALELDPGHDQVLGEDIALGEVVVIGLEGVQRGAEGLRQLPDLPVLLGRELVEVLVDRLRRLDAVADAVQAGHELRREGEVRV